MASGFVLTDAQRAAFEEILSGKSSISAGIEKEKTKFDAFNALIGGDRILTEIKTTLPLNFTGQALVNCDPSNSKEVVVALAKFSSQSGRVPILVLMNYNYETIQKALTSVGIKGDYFIIDTVSKGIAKVPTEKNIFFIDSLRNLTQLQIQIVNLTKDVPKGLFIFDSMSMIELYHEEEVASKFIYSLTKLLHKSNSTGLYVSSKQGLSSKLSQFFDESVQLKKFI